MRSFTNCEARCLQLFQTEVAADRRGLERAGDRHRDRASEARTAAAWTAACRAGSRLYGHLLLTAELDERRATTTLDEAGRADCVRTWHVPNSPVTKQYNCVSSPCVACCPLVSHGEYADWTDRQTDGGQTVTLRFPLDAASVKTNY